MKIFCQYFTSESRYYVVDGSWESLNLKFFTVLSFIRTLSNSETVVNVAMLYFVHPRLNHSVNKDKILSRSKLGIFRKVRNDKNCNREISNHQDVYFQTGRKFFKL